MMELKPINYKEEIVITTKTLAEVYECSEKQIKQNYNNNKDKFIEGKHYYKIKGEELKNLRVENFDLQISSKVRTLYLWTKRGASRHCKMLGTDKAWEMFDTLEENYFNPKTPQLTKKEELQLAILNGDDLERICALQEYEYVVVEKATKPLIEKIEKDKPKVTFANRVLKSNDNVLVRQVAKMVSDEGLVIGERKLYKKLREWGYICNGSTEPTQVGMNRKYFTLKINVVQTPYGIKSSRTTLVTPKGQIHIVKRLMEEMES